MVKVNRQISYLRQNWLGPSEVFLDLLNQSNSLIMRLQNRDEVDDAFCKPLLLSVSRITILIEAGSLPQMLCCMIEIENANGTMGKHSR